MSRFICKRPSNASEWFNACQNLFNSDLKSHNLSWGFGRGLIGAPSDPKARFAYILDTNNNQIIQSILRSAEYAPTLFSRILGDLTEHESEIASSFVESLRSNEEKWELFDVLGPSSFMKHLTSQYNRLQQDETSQLLLWRQETWDQCTNLNPELSNSFKSNAEFRRATSDDHLDELINLREEFLQQVIPQLPPRAANEAWIKRQIAASKLWIISEGSKIVSIASSDRESPDYESIVMLYTPPSQRGKGFATLLIYRLTEHLLSSKKAVLLGIDLRNSISHHLYRKCGYQMIFEQGHYCVPRLLKDLDGK